VKLKQILEASPFPYGTPHRSGLNRPYTTYTSNRGYFAGSNLSKDWIWQKKKTQTEPPNDTTSFEGELLRLLNMKRQEGIAPNKKWTYTQKNRIENLLQAGFIEFSGKRYYITTGGEKRLKELMMTPHLNMYTPSYANAFSMRSQRRF